MVKMLLSIIFLSAVLKKLYKNACSSALPICYICLHLSFANIFVIVIHTFLVPGFKSRQTLVQTPFRSDVILKYKKTSIKCMCFSSVRIFLGPTKMRSRISSITVPLFLCRTTSRKISLVSVPELALKGLKPPACFCSLTNSWNG